MEQKLTPVLNVFFDTGLSVDIVKIEVSKDPCRLGFIILFHAV